jgi:hypothetical protein
MEGDVGDALTGRPVGSSYVTFSNGYLRGKVDYVLVVIYDNTAARPTTDARVRDRNDAIELTVGDKYFPNIRGTNKLYIVRGNDIQVYDLATTSESVIEEVSVTSANDADEYVDNVVAAIAKR